MTISQVLNEITIVYSKKDIQELKKALQEIVKDYYCFNFDAGLYQFRKREFGEMSKFFKGSKWKNNK